MDNFVVSYTLLFNLCFLGVLFVLFYFFIFFFCYFLWNMCRKSRKFEHNFKCTKNKQQKKYINACIHTKQSYKQKILQGLSDMKRASLYRNILYSKRSRCTLHKYFVSFQIPNNQLKWIHHFLLLMLGK